MDGVAPLHNRMVDYLINSQKGDAMADENQSDATVDDGIQDVSLTTPLDAQVSDSSETAADKAADEGAATSNETHDNKTDDAKTNEATDQKEDDASAKTDDDQTTDDQKTDAPAPQTKEERDQAARSAWQERQRTRQEVASQLDQQYGPKTQQDLVNEGMDAQDAGIEAIRQEMAYKEERTRVAELNAGMRAEAVEIYHDFPIFDSKSPDYDEEFAKAVEDEYKLSARLQTNEQGIVLNADVSLYDHYQKMYNIYNRGSSRGAQQKQNSVQDMMSRAENPGGSSSTNAPAPGSLEEMESRLGDVVIT